MSKAALSPQLFKDPECWSGQGLNQWPPTWQTGAYPIDLIGQNLQLVGNGGVLELELLMPVSQLDKTDLISYHSNNSLFSTITCKLLQPVLQRIK